MALQYKGNIEAVAHGYLYLNTLNDFTNTATAPDKTYLITDANPSSVNAAHLQVSLSAVGSIFTVTDFTSSGNDIHPGLVSNGTSGSFDPTGNLLFNGFLIRTVTKTLVGLYDPPTS